MMKEGSTIINPSDFDLCPREQAKVDVLQASMHKNEEILRNLNPIILDLTIREPCVGTQLGHTLENKKSLLAIVKEMGFKDILLGTFNVSSPDEPQVDDYFCMDVKND